MYCTSTVHYRASFHYRLPLHDPALVASLCCTTLISKFEEFAYSPQHNQSYRTPCVKESETRSYQQQQSHDDQESFARSGPHDVLRADNLDGFDHLHLSLCRLTYALLSDPG